MTSPGNNTLCSPSSTCTILDGVTTNGSFYVAIYNPDAPVVLWRQRLELATICICNSLTCIVIIARLWYRCFKLKRFRGDDQWMALALVIMIIYTASQINTNMYGSGLHFENVPEDWRRLHWHWEMGWSGYWIVVSCIKMSVCFFFFEFLTHHHRNLRYSAVALCCLIFSLGIVMLVSWIFQCTPILSNFLWSVYADSCVNYDIFRWLWITVSVPIDIAIMSVPLRILKQTSLKTHERRLLKLVFCATLLGTVTCVIGIFGAYQTRTRNANSAYWDEVPWIMMNDIEILMYALGASFPVLSRYIVQRGDPGPSAQHLNFTSWARNIPDFFTAQHTAQDKRNHGPENTQTYAIELQSADKRLDEVSVACDIIRDEALAKSFKSGASSGPSEPDSICDLDVEKGRVGTNVMILKKHEDSQ